MAAEKSQRSSQFRIIDSLLLTAGCAYTLAVLVPAAAREPDGGVIGIAIVTGMTLVGSAISYPIWRFLLRRRITVLAVNYLGYYLALVGLGIVAEGKVLSIVPVIAKGPLSFFGYDYPLRQSYPFVRDLPESVVIIGFLALPIFVLMCAHVFRRNLIGVILTSLGTALWYLAGFGAAMARMP